jgi:Development and cell death domain
MTECYTLGLFGTNEPYGRYVRKGDLSLLYNYSDNQVYGVWNATSDGGTYNRAAWKGRYPHQVPVQQVSKRVLSVSRGRVQSLVGDAANFGRIYEGEAAQEILQHFAETFSDAVEGGIAVRESESDYRTRFPAEFFCDDGHRVRSQGEKIIDDWLHKHRVQHGYEPIVPVPGHLIPDFVVYSRKGEPVYIEYWGLVDDPVYQQRRLHKSQLYAKLMLPLIELYPRDLQIIDTALGGLLRRLDVQFT